MNRFFLGAAAAALVTTSAIAQDAAPVVPALSAMPAPVAATAPSAAPQYSLPANTEIVVSMNEELSTKRNEEGDMFSMTVAQDVRLGQYVVIPAGTRAIGEITWITGKGMFGKSGKMDIEMRYIDFDGRRIPIDGSFRQEGEGNTVATVAGVIAIPIAGLFITGRSGVIPRGRELTAHLANQLAVALPAGAVVRQASVVTSQPQTAQAVLATATAPAPAPVSDPAVADAQPLSTVNADAEADE